MNLATDHTTATTDAVALKESTERQSAIDRIRVPWAQSRLFRALLVVSITYALLRLVIHAVALGYLALSGSTEGHDLQIYLDAAANLQAGRDLYPQGTIQDIEFYQYSPTYALIFSLFLPLSFGLTGALLSVLHVVAYVALYLAWDRIFARLGIKEASKVLPWTLPLWLVFSAFWSDLLYVNVYILLALLATLFIDAILDERLAPAVLWLSVILLMKPQWAFALALPLLLGRYRFFFNLVGLTIVAYVVIMGSTMFIAEPLYGWQQYIDYFRLLFEISDGNYAWKDPTFGFLGYNHSITQILVYLLGPTTTALRLSLLVRGFLLAPLGVVALRHLRRPCRRPSCDAPLLSLDLVFAFYTAAFVWLNVVWELTLGIVVFVYLLAVLPSGWAMRAVWVVFLLYALLDLWRLLSVFFFGADTVLSGSFVLTDPAVYLPVVMFVILTFYLLLVRRLWRARPLLAGSIA